jgi:hypothetical protein
MALVHVDGHYRRRNGQREWVESYTYMRPDKPDTDNDAPAKAAKGKVRSFAPKGSPKALSSRALGRARLIQKRQQLTGGQTITAETLGWTTEDGRLVMDADTYEAWLANTIRRAREALVSKGDTVKKFKTEVGGTDYTPARKAQHKKVIEAMLARARKVPKGHKMVMTGGRPGAGKSSSLRAQGINDENYFVIDSDAVKEEMIRQGMAPDIEGLTPFEAAGLIHEESSDLADILIERLAMQGTNFVLDGTMAWIPYVTKHAADLHEMGYKIKGLFVNVTPETSRRRALARHKKGVEDFLTKGLGFGGRFVDPTIATRPTNNRRNFEILQDLFEEWVVYDNEVDGHLPAMMDSSGHEVRFSVEALTDRNSDGIVEDVEYYIGLATTTRGGE